MSNYKYKEGQRYGPYNILFLKRLPNARGIFQCPFCDNTFEAQTSKVGNGNTTRCKECIKKRRFNFGKNRAVDLTGKINGKLEYLYPTDKRVQGNIIWKVLCHQCGRETEVSTVNWKRNLVCNKCAHEKDITNERYGKLIGLYKTNKKKNGFNVWLCQCDCGETTELSIQDWGRTQSCGKCKCSHGENKIKEWLEKNNIKYFYNYTSHNCRNPKTHRKLRFDFYLPNYNCCIEYDGEQHFRESNMCSDSLEDRQYRDEIKNQYCKNNNIKLIRISYINYNNIESILNEFITGKFDR